MFCGENRDCQGGLGGELDATSSPMPVKTISEPIEQLASRTAFTLALGQSGKLYWSGLLEDWSHEKKSSLVEYDQKMPESKIVDIKCKSVNVAILTENSQIWYQGEFDMDKDEESQKQKYL